MNSLHSRISRGAAAGVLAAMMIGSVIWITLAIAARSNSSPLVTFQVHGGDTPPIEVDTLSSLSTVLSRLHQCAAPGAERIGRVMGSQEQSTTPDDCAGVIYVWSPLMPLSRLGIPNVAAAAKRLNIDLIVIGGSEIYAGVAAKAPSAQEVATPTEVLAAELAVAGATTHYPAVLTHRRGHLVGSAIVGYKTSDTYRRMIEERLREPRPRQGGVEAADAVLSVQGQLVGNDHIPVDRSSNLHDCPFGVGSFHQRIQVADFPVPTAPGAYFRAVPSRSGVVFAAEQVVYFLDFIEGGTWVGPGYIDFIPAPDGRFFVTPSRNRAGLEFYDALAVFDSAAVGAALDVQPAYVDTGMVDQYPSVALLTPEARSDTSLSIYRVLTSWLDRAIFRDYEARTVGAQRTFVVLPQGEPVIACPEYQVSIPILSPNGRELAGRDESTGTTKIFRIDSNGTCTEVADLGFQTGKVAWAPDGRRIAFAVPQGAVRNALGEKDPSELRGVFVLERADLRLTRIKGSEAVNRLTFPDFVNQNSIAFLISTNSRDDNRPSHWFRVVSCVD